MMRVAQLRDGTLEVELEGRAVRARSVGEAIVALDRHRAGDPCPICDGRGTLTRSAIPGLRCVVCNGTGRVHVGEADPR